MGLSVWQLLIIAVVILVMFGRGKISEMMGDFGKGVKSFKEGVSDEEKPTEPTRQISPPHAGEGAVPPQTTETKDDSGTTR